MNKVTNEDSWESLGRQGDPTSPSYRKSVLNIHWKDLCWNWSFNTLATWWEQLTQWKRPDAEKVWWQKRGRQRLRWLNGITDSMDMNLGELWQMVKDREAWCASVHEVPKSRTRLGDWTTRTSIPEDPDYFRTDRWEPAPKSTSCFINLGDLSPHTLPSPSLFKNVLLSMKIPDSWLSGSVIAK